MKRLILILISPVLLTLCGILAMQVVFAQAQGDSAAEAVPEPEIVVLGETPDLDVTPKSPGFGAFETIRTTAPPNAHMEHFSDPSKTGKLSLALVEYSFEKLEKSNPEIARMKKQEEAYFHVILEELALAGYRPATGPEMACLGDSLKAAAGNKRPFWALGTSFIFPGASQWAVRALYADPQNEDSFKGMQVGDSELHLMVEESMRLSRDGLRLLVVKNP